MNKTYIKKFIRDFNFPNPNWENLPVGFLDLSKEGLTKEEGHLLDAIKLAWLTTQPEGRKTLYKNTIKSGLFVFISLMGLISLINHTFLSNEIEFSSTVQAATVKIDEVIQSTRSAILRK